MIENPANEAQAIQAPKTGMSDVIKIQVRTRVLLCLAVANIILHYRRTNRRRETPEFK